jgi:ATP-dependent DNA ligase
MSPSHKTARAAGFLARIYEFAMDTLQVRKATLASVAARAGCGLWFNEHMDEEDGPLVFLHACKLGLEGIVSKRKDSRYRSGRSPDWIKSKNPRAPAVTREAEEDWGQWQTRRPNGRKG